MLDALRGIFCTQCSSVLLSLAQENADVCTVWVESLQTRYGGQRKISDRVKNLGLCHCMTFFPPIVVC